MDIVRQTKTASKFRWLGFASGLAVLAIAIVAYSNVSLTAKAVNRNSVSFAQVKRGDMAVKVFGNGTIVPKEIRWVAAGVAGRVNRVLVKPGALVEQGQMLLVLDNPELAQAAEESAWEVEASQAELVALEVTLESNVLDQHAKVETVVIDLESARMQYDAEASLVKNGHGSISMLDHKRSELRVRQLENDLEVERARLVRMQKNKQAQLNASSARLRKLENVLLRAQRNVESLNVVAPASGVVQEVAVELGQRLTIGSNIVKVADQSQLIAELKIAERMINDVAIGQHATIDTRKSKITGRVVRIDPAVVSGSVLVEIEFNQALPPEARPDLSVSGEVLVADLRDTLYVQRPVTAQSDQQSILYKLTKQNAMAHRVAVHYGQGSSDRIQILSGLEVGDTVILSDHSSWEHHQEIRLN